VFTRRKGTRKDEDGKKKDEEEEKKEKGGRGKGREEKKKGKETEGASGNKTNVNMIQDTMIQNTTMFYSRDRDVPKPAMSSTDPTIRLWNPIMSLFGILSSNSLDLAQVSTFTSR
jgi:hypothetical protein